MFLKKLKLSNFKNHEQSELTFNTQITSLIGRNGMGKTNLLDAIHYLSFTKSSLNPSDNQNIRYGEPYFFIEGTIEKKEKDFLVRCAYEAGNKKNFLVNKVPYEKYSDHIGEFPVVLISPNDTDLVREYSDLRRKFFDGLICQIDRPYLEALIRYSHFLKQRNSLLKSLARKQSPDGDLMDKYDAELASNGKILWAKRRDFMKEFIPVFLKKYEELSGNEPVDIKYVSDFDKGEPVSLFKQNREKDIIMQRTTCGVHRDDFEFLLTQKPLKKNGSQGQQKSFVISLRLSQFELIQAAKGYRPILLLDDIFDKLDDDRIDRLTSMIGKDDFGQIFITDARPERTRSLVEKLDQKVGIFEVENGTCIASQETTKDKN